MALLCICAYFIFSQEELLWYRCLLGFKEWGSNLGELSEASKNLKGFGEGRIKKAAFMSLNMKHINVFL